MSERVGRSARRVLHGVDRMRYRVQGCMGEMTGHVAEMMNRRRGGMRYAGRRVFDRVHGRSGGMLYCVNHVAGRVFYGVNGGFHRRGYRMYD